MENLSEMDGLDEEEEILATTAAISAFHNEYRILGLFHE